MNINRNHEIFRSALNPGINLFIGGSGESYERRIGESHGDFFAAAVVSRVKLINVVSLSVEISVINGKFVSRFIVRIKRSVNVDEFAVRVMTESDVAVVDIVYFNFEIRV